MERSPDGAAAADRARNPGTLIPHDSSAHEPGDRQNPRNIGRDNLVELANAEGKKVKIFGLTTGPAERNADTQRQTLKLTETRTEIGRGDPSDVENSKARLAAIEATIPSFVTTEKQAGHRLAETEVLGEVDLLEPRCAARDVDRDDVVGCAIGVNVGREVAEHGDETVHMGSL